MINEIEGGTMVFWLLITAGTSLMLIGGLSNFAVLWINDNVMPIIVKKESIRIKFFPHDSELENSKGKYAVYSSSEGVRLALLCDRFNRIFNDRDGRKYFRSCSIGDLSIFTGIAFFVAGLLLLLLSSLQFLVRVFT